LVASIGLAGCGASTQLVTPWLEIDRTSRILDIPHVIKTGPEPSEHVILRTADGWKEIDASGPGVRLAEGKTALLGRVGEQRQAIIDQDGEVVASLPCADWVSGDGTAIVCAETDRTPGHDEGTLDVHLRIFSASGVLLRDDTGTLVPSTDAAFMGSGIVAILGRLPDGDIALRSVHMPRDLNFGAPRLSRLFVVRKGKTVVLARRTDSPENAYSASGFEDAVPSVAELEEGTTLR